MTQALYWKIREPNGATLPCGCGSVQPFVSEFEGTPYRRDAALARLCAPVVRSQSSPGPRASALTAVDIENGAGDEAVGHQEKDRLRDIARGSRPADRKGSADFVEVLTPSRLVEAR